MAAIIQIFIPHVAERDESMHGAQPQADTHNPNRYEKSAGWEGGQPLIVSRRHRIPGTTNRSDSDVAKTPAMFDWPQYQAAVGFVNRNTPATITTSVQNPHTLREMPHRRRALKPDQSIARYNFLANLMDDR
jgi:hypothetical protein